MILKSFVFNPFSTNCFIAASEGEAAIVDPSCMDSNEIDRVLDFVRDNDLTVRHLLLTHAHIDHIFGCAPLARGLGLKIGLNRLDVPLLENAEVQARMFGVEIENPVVDMVNVEEGDRIEFGNVVWDVLATPGHSPGSISFVDKAGSYVIAGDVLFAGSIGRTDLWQGSLPVLMESIFQKIVPLGDDYIVYSGHGPQTTVGEEVRSNPFLTDIAERIS